MVFYWFSNSETSIKNMEKGTNYFKYDLTVNQTLLQNVPGQETCSFLDKLKSHDV